MLSFLLQRLGQAIVTIALVATLVFLVVYFIPGDPVTVILGAQGTPQEAAVLRHSLGLDQPIYVRYGVWVWHVLHLDLGTSILFGRSVLGIIGDALPVTVELTLLSLLLALLIAVPAGLVAGVRQHSWLDLAARGFSFFGQAIPGFWLGLVLIWLFAVAVPLFPTFGFTALTSDPLQNLRGMVLPTITLGVYVSAPLTRYLRAGVIRTLSDEHVTVARAKGLSRRRVLSRHVVRNSLIPFVTQLGLQIAYLLGGAVVIEQVFSLPGMGQLALTAFRNRDYPVVQGVVLLIASGFVFINLAVDLLYGVLDPRIRVGGAP